MSNPILLFIIGVVAMINAALPYLPLIDAGDPSNFHWRMHMTSAAIWLTGLIFIIIAFVERRKRRKS